MKRIVPILLALILMPSITAAQVSRVSWEPSIDQRIGSLLFYPASLYVNTGQTIEMKGKGCAIEGDFTGVFRYEVYGVAGKDSGGCRVACYNCYDYEACGGQYCGDICIQGPDPSTQQKCGDLPNCGTGCGVDCTQMMDSQVKSISISEGSCTPEYSFQTTIGSDWQQNAWYVAILYVIDSNGNVLDIEYRDLGVGMFKRFDVQILNFIIVGLSTATIAGSVGTIIQVLRRLF